MPSPGAPARRPLNNLPITACSCQPRPAPFPARRHRMHTYLFINNHLTDNTAGTSWTPEMRDPDGFRLVSGYSSARSTPDRGAIASRRRDSPVRRSEPAPGPAHAGGAGRARLSQSGDAHAHPGRSSRLKGVLRQRAVQPHLFIRSSISYLSLFVFSGSLNELLAVEQGYVAPAGALTATLRRGAHFHALHRRISAATLSTSLLPLRHGSAAYGTRLRAPTP